MNRPLLAQLARYAFVGGSVALGYLAVASLAHARFGVGLQGANLVAILAMHPLSYLGHRYFTFAYAGAWWPSIRRFAAVALLSTLVSVAISTLQQVAGIGVLPALAINCIAVPTITFAALKLWVFGRVTAGPGGHKFDFQ